jgi:hypothetical protein
MIFLFNLNILFVYVSLSMVKDGSTLTKDDLRYWITGERYVEITLTVLLIQRLF